ncbi:MAG: SPOR domain-containing protein [Candidatus Omnitrophica bacterium]|nr:SPOR domain-containing protein [Candidatus Omnitrophota bacterium]
MKQHSFDGGLGSLIKGEAFMAGGKGNEIWLIVLLVVVAAVFGVMSFSKDKAQPAKVSAQDVLADKAEPAAVVKKDNAPVTMSGIKPAHSEADQAAVAAVKPASSVVMAPRVLAAKESFAVQVYSFKDKARADAALEKLKAKGHKAYIMVSDLGARGVWYRVRVGSFGAEDEAKAALEAITVDFKSGIIVTE